MKTIRSIRYGLLLSIIYTLTAEAAMETKQARITIPTPHPRLEFQKRLGHLDKDHLGRFGLQKIPSQRDTLR